MALYDRLCCIVEEQLAYVLRPSRFQGILLGTKKASYIALKGVISLEVAEPKPLSLCLSMLSGLKWHRDRTKFCSFVQEFMSPEDR